ncbi:MAG: Fic family protein [Verrucomicrobiia bacterium]
MLSEVEKEVIARSVHESNWQEGLYLDRGRTRELAEAVFESVGDVSGPHLDMEAVLEHHRKDVVALKRKGASIEEVAAHNLARAHVALRWIGGELMHRQTASLMHALEGFRKKYPELKAKMSAETQKTIERGFQVMENMKASALPIDVPITEGSETQGALLNKLLAQDFDTLLHPMRPAYVHFLHRITMMGIAHTGKCGVFRKTPVHVGNPELYFPPPSLVPKLMEQFCSDFPTILPGTVKYDPILMAAQASHKFVRIHPYADGNGRVSRLLMNLVLWKHHPPVYLKADKKGRHRYGQALRRADRGNTKPLAGLIGISLVEIYGKLLDAITP